MLEVETIAHHAIEAGLSIHHQDLGPGMLESVYEAVLAARLARMGLHVERQRPIAIEYDGMVLQEGFRADLVIEGQLMIELKVTERFAPVHGKQLLTYLRLSKLSLGLLMNFGAPTFREGLKRIVNNHTDLSGSPLLINRPRPH